jgi:hypothetical protein
MANNKNTTRKHLGPYKNGRFAMMKLDDENENGHNDSDGDFAK